MISRLLHGIPSPVYAWVTFLRWDGESAQELLP